MSFFSAAGTSPEEDESSEEVGLEGASPPAPGAAVSAPGVVSDALIDALVVMGDEAAVAARLQELLAAGLDELLVNGLSLGDPAAERERLIRFAGGLG